MPHVHFFGNVGGGKIHHNFLAQWCVWHSESDGIAGHVPDGPTQIRLRPSHIEESGTRQGQGHGWRCGFILVEPLLQAIHELLCHGAGIGLQRAGQLECGIDLVVPEFGAGGQSDGRIGGCELGWRRRHGLFHESCFVR